MEVDETCESQSENTRSNHGNTGRSCWGTDEQALLISLVIENEKVLFGAAKGDGGDGNINQLKRRAWEDVADKLNA